MALAHFVFAGHLHITLLLNLIHILIMLFVGTARAIYPSIQPAHLHIGIGLPLARIELALTVNNTFS